MYINIYKQSRKANKQLIFSFDGKNEMFKAEEGEEEEQKKRKTVAVSQVNRLLCKQSVSFKRSRYKHMDVLYTCNQTR